LTARRSASRKTEMVMSNPVPAILRRSQRTATQKALDQEPKGEGFSLPGSTCFYCSIALVGPLGDKGQPLMLFSLLWQPLVPCCVNQVHPFLLSLWTRTLSLVPWPIYSSE
jgi:hypothetical protein